MKNKYKVLQNKDLGIYKVNDIKINDVVKLKNNDEMRIEGFREEDGNIIVMGYFSSDELWGWWGIWEYCWSNLILLLTFN